MATVPRLTTQRIAPSPRQPTDPRTTSTAGIGAVAVGGALDVFAKELERINEARVSEAEVSFRSAISGLLDDPNTGLHTKQGSAAIEAWDSFSGQVQERASSVESALANETQKVLFRRRAELLAQDANQRAGAYVQRETERVGAEAFKANISLDQESIRAATSRGDLESAEQTIDSMDERIALYADSRGISDETEEGKAILTHMRQDARSASRLQQVNVLVDQKQVAAARDLYARYGSEMTTIDRAKATELIEVGGSVEEAQAESDRILATYTRIEQEGAAREAAKQLSGKLRDDVLRRVEGEFQVRRRLESQADANVLDKAMDLAMSTGDLSGLSVQDWVTLRRKNWMRDVERIASFTRSGAPVETDPDAMFQLLAATPEQLADPSFRSYMRTQLSQSDFMRAQELFAQPTIQGRMAQDEREIRAAASGAGIVPPQTAPGGWTKTQKAEFDQFRSQALEALQAARQQAPGGQLTPQQQRRTVQDLSDQTVLIKKFGRDPEKVATAVSQDDIDRAYIPIERIKKEDPDAIDALRLFASRNQFMLGPKSEKIGRMYAIPYLYPFASEEEIVQMRLAILRGER